LQAGNPVLVAEIQRAMREGGPMTFAAFMQAALYHPELGYYSRPGMTTGVAGDYYTSSDLTPAFGRLIARQIVEIASRTAGPADPESSVPFTVIEMGPGSGRLACDIMDTLAGEAPALAARTSYVLVEISPSLRSAQRARVDASPGAQAIARVLWRSWDDLLARPPAGPLKGCLVANEFLDALPVHMVERRGGRLREVHVVPDGDGFTEALLDLSTPRLARHLEDLGIELAEGQRAEVCLQAMDFLAGLGRLFGPAGRGGAILIDYGHQAGELYAAHRTGGTLMCYAAHRASGDVESPYQRVGEQDMTAHVDLTSVRRHAEAAGFDVAPVISQMRFLVSLGLPGMMAELAARADAAGVAAQRERLALHSLISPEGMGEIFQVMLLTRGTPAAALTGARDPFRSGGRSEDAA
jgi:SAM-dependent MidA family methyltransferase